MELLQGVLEGVHSTTFAQARGEGQSSIHCSASWGAGTQNVDIHIPKSIYIYIVFISFVVSVS